MSNVYEDRIARFRRSAPEKTNVTLPEQTTSYIPVSAPARPAKKSYEEIGAELREYSKIHMQRFIEKKVRNHAPLVSRHGLDRKHDFAAMAEFEQYFGIDAIKKCFYETEERLNIWYDPGKRPNAEPRASENHGLEVPEWAKGMEIQMAVPEQPAKAEPEIPSAVSKIPAVPVQKPEPEVFVKKAEPVQAVTPPVPEKPVIVPRRFIMPEKKQAAASDGSAVRVSVRLDIDTANKFTSATLFSSSAELARTYVENGLSEFMASPDKFRKEISADEKQRGSKKSFSFRFDPDIGAQLKACADFCSVSLSDLVRFMIKKGVIMSGR